MTTGWIRPYVNISYEPQLSDDGKYALRYRNLRVKYVEERVRKGKRGWIVVERSVPEEIATPDFFAFMTIFAIAEDTPAKLRRYKLEATIEPNDSDYIHGFIDRICLPYGYSPVEAEVAEEKRQDGAPLVHLQKRLLNDFEVDSIRAVVGDYGSAAEVRNQQETVQGRLREAWKQLELRPMSAEDAEAPPESEWSLGVARTLYSPVVKTALYEIVREEAYA